MPSTISVQPAVGTVPANLAVTLLPGGGAASMHVLADMTGAAIMPATDISAAAFGAAVAALSAILMPRGPTAQQGALLFGLPI